MTEYDARTLKLVETLVATFLLDPAHERRPEALTELVETVLNRELEKCRRKKIEKFEKVVDSLVRVFLSTNEWPPETNTDAIGRQVEKFVREEFFKLLHAKTPLERDVLKVYRNSELFSRSKTEELQEYMRFVTERVQTSLNQAATQARASRDRSNALKRESRARMKLLKEAHGGHHAPLEEAVDGQIRVIRETTCPDGFTCPEYWTHGTFSFLRNRRPRRDEAGAFDCRCGSVHRRSHGVR